MKCNRSVRQKHKEKIKVYSMHIDWGVCLHCGQNNAARYPDQHHCLKSKKCQCADCRKKRKEL